MKFNRTYAIYIVVLIGFLVAPLFLQEFRLGLLAKFLCYAIVAIGISLIWGYTGILSLGHGVFFGLGAYCMGMYLKLEGSTTGLPDFMEWSGVTTLPAFWKPFTNPVFAIGAGIIVPMLLATVLGYFTFKNRIRGVYFSLISQAVVVVVVTLFIGKQDLTGGTNGLTSFYTFLGMSLADSFVQQILYFVTVGVLAIVFALSIWLTKSRAGKVLMAIRDGENRVRFLGFNPTSYKVFVYSLSAAFAGVAGMLFVLQVGIISPAMMGITPSIEMVLWVAIGGRHSLLGAVFGAIFTNGAKSLFSETYPDIWLILLGLLFIVVVLFLPNGMAGLVQSIQNKFKKLKSRKEKSHEPDTMVR
ncbi:urea ABC transporter permease subunit UrtC [Priestia flexa]|uniref:Urea ABC transporter permease subunit UrtC n=1 Tax=Priestia flexa TaxID=86664 RepID=A0ABU4J4K0_9BACI|nr:urea ABC transporter permease subunit UrtC [Priestia flexa]MBY6085641.1 urea ABC transporter permease subunit UrtC [Priestia flexa]MCG7313703.1 urea ABC transporter permease subunit UrtC [Priestia flexa]MCM3067482.1 urea ABC transporter permease subunit UrtC [Priestia flexa]MCP1189647.1 urea ABC transporter permease subunit UrtC [Priestia flexa]MDW8515914.1 urea ABC transporter permease subunit UrtC [Priestia flexa]